MLFLKNLIGEALKSLTIHQFCINEYCSRSDAISQTMLSHVGAPRITLVVWHVVWGCLHFLFLCEKNSLNLIAIPCKTGGSQ